MGTITVRAKIDAGYHPGIGKHIYQGETYEIDERNFGDQLFERVDPPASAAAPALHEPKGGSESCL